VDTVAFHDDHHKGWEFLRQKQKWSIVGVVDRLRS
jgi:hypothetical protein